MEKQMTKNSELRIDARYIHTGNSGVTLMVERDVKKPTRGILKIRNGSHGAFSTEMEIRGNDYDGMSANQLRDLALLFLESANTLDDITAGKDGVLMYSNENTPSIVPVRGHNTSRLSMKMEKFLYSQLKAKGDKDPWNTILKIQNTEEGMSGTTVENGTPCSDEEALVIEKKNKKKNPEFDTTALMIERIKDLASKL
jgi:hypothetical protein